ncbi:hypothetical protein DXG03_003713 [Asterophora parasitica]|uniref:Uncharacterized protein n=1 Tax=Asterophora parasitica TaxID=117018 RepID=A0A9P7GFJ7_9AGAR|nr:hypothetical protein DXG03_003713 [Asterophora parasitica]
MASTGNSFTIAEGRLAGLVLESVILGFYLITFAHTLQALLTTGTRWKRSSEINHTLCIVALLMFCDVVVGFAMSFRIVWRAFILEPGNTQFVFGDLTNWTTTGS